MQATIPYFNPMVPKTPKEILFTWVYGIFWFLTLYAGQLYLTMPSEGWPSTIEFMGLVPIVPLIVSLVVAGYALSPTLVMLLPLGYYNKCPFSSKIVRLVNYASEPLVVMGALLLGAITFAVFVGIWVGLYQVIDMLLDNSDHLTVYTAVMLVGFAIFLLLAGSIGDYHRRKSIPTPFASTVPITSKESLLSWSCGIACFILAYTYQIYFMAQRGGVVEIGFFSAIPIIPFILASAVVMSYRPPILSPTLAKVINSWPALSLAGLALALSVLTIVFIISSIWVAQAIFSLALELSRGQATIGIIVILSFITFLLSLYNRYIDQQSSGKMPKSQKQASFSHEVIFCFKDMILSSVILGAIVAFMMEYTVLCFLTICFYMLFKSTTGYVVSKISLPIVESSAPKVLDTAQAFHASGANPDPEALGPIVGAAQDSPEDGANPGPEALGPIAGAAQASLEDGANPGPKPSESKIRRPETSKELLFCCTYGILWFLTFYAFQLEIMTNLGGWSEATFFLIAPIFPFLLSLFFFHIALSPTAVALTTFHLLGGFNEEYECYFTPLLLRWINSLSGPLVVVFSLVWFCISGIVIALVTGIIFTIMFMLFDRYLKNTPGLYEILRDIIGAAVVVGVFILVRRYLRKSKLNPGQNQEPKPILTTTPVNSPNEYVLRWSYAVFCFLLGYATQLYFLLPGREWSEAIFALMPIIPIILVLGALEFAKPPLTPALAQWLKSLSSLWVVVLSMVWAALTVLAIIGAIAIMPDILSWMLKPLLTNIAYMPFYILLLFVLPMVAGLVRAILGGYFRALGLGAKQIDSKLNVFDTFFENGFKNLGVGSKAISGEQKKVSFLNELLFLFKSIPIYCFAVGMMMILILPIDYKKSMFEDFLDFGLPSYLNQEEISWRQSTSSQKQSHYAWFEFNANNNFVVLHSSMDNILTPTERDILAKAEEKKGFVAETLTGLVKQKWTKTKMSLLRKTWIKSDNNLVLNIATELYPQKLAITFHLNTDPPAEDDPSWDQIIEGFIDLDQGTLMVSDSLGADHPDLEIALPKKGIYKFRVYYAGLSDRENPDTQEYWQIFLWPTEASKESNEIKVIKAFKE